MKCTQKLSGAITKQQFEALPWIPENTSASFQNSNGTFNNLNDYFLYSPFFLMQFVLQNNDTLESLAKRSL